MDVFYHKNHHKSVITVHNYGENELVCYLQFKPVFSIALDKVSIPIFFFLFLQENICCCYSLEVPLSILLGGNKILYL